MRKVVLTKPSQLDQIAEEAIQIILPQGHPMLL